MTPSEEKHTTPVSLAIDLVLMITFFVGIFSVLRSHVPSTNPKMITLWAAIATSCLTGVFWLALQMFRVVLKAQLRSRE